MRASAPRCTIILRICRGRKPRRRDREPQPLNLSVSVRLVAVGQVGMPLIILRPTNLHWINGSADDPADLCAHAGVDFRIGGDTPLRGGDWNVSAAALYLLRMLSQPH